MKYLVNLLNKLCIILYLLLELKKLEIVIDKQYLYNKENIKLLNQKNDLLFSKHIYNLVHITYK